MINYVGSHMYLNQIMERNDTYLPIGPVQMLIINIMLVSGPAIGIVLQVVILPVSSDLAIYWTLGNFLKPLATINLPKSPTFLGNFCKGVKIYHFSSEISFGLLL